MRKNKQPLRVSKLGPRLQAAAPLLLRKTKGVRFPGLPKLRLQVRRIGP
jgi:hypothetical protein